MPKTEKLTADDKDWEPDGKLGNDEAHVRRAGKGQGEELDKALGLQLISIRLQKSLIEDLKFIAKARGIGYQPLVRDNLTRFVEQEKKKIIQEVMERRRQEKEFEKLHPAGTEVGAVPVVRRSARARRARG